MDYTRKAHYVLDGHCTTDPEDSTYGVPHRGLEFGLENVGKRAKIVRALYGGKSSGRDFCNHLCSYMINIGLESCKADPDFWIRKSVKLDGSKYNEYALLNVDDLQVVSENAQYVIRMEIGKYFELKEALIGIPDIYLGGKISKVELNNRATAYIFSFSQYVKSAVLNVEEYLAQKGREIPCRATAPLKCGYQSEIDVIDELDEGDVAYYQSLLIGILRWMVDLEGGLTSSIKY